MAKKIPPGSLPKLYETLKKKYTILAKKFKIIKTGFTKSRLMFRRLLRNYILIKKRYNFLLKHSNQKVRELTEKINEDRYQIILTSNKVVLNMSNKLLEQIEMSKDEFSQSFYIDILFEKYLPVLDKESIKKEIEPFLFPIMLKNFQVEDTHIHPYVYFEISGKIEYNQSKKIYMYILVLKDVSASIELQYFQKTDTLISSLSVANYNLMRAKKSIEMHKIMLIYLITSIVEEYNQETSIHLQRIKTITTALTGECLRLGIVKVDNYDLEEYVKDINYTSVLHDIGKMGIPSELLSKENKLTPEEIEIVRKHSKIGAEYIHKIIKVFLNHPAYSLYVDFLRVPYEICLYHHERWDGKGYPEGLKGELIPISARIVSVADTYDAIRANRSYQGSQSHEKAVNIIKSEAGKQFDPNIVKAFENILPILEKIDYNDETFNF